MPQKTLLDILGNLPESDNEAMNLIADAMERTGRSKDTYNVAKEGVISVARDTLVFALRNNKEHGRLYLSSQREGRSSSVTAD